MTHVRQEPTRPDRRQPYPCADGLRGNHARTVGVLGAHIVCGGYAPDTGLAQDSPLAELNIRRTALRVLADPTGNSRQKIITRVTPPLSSRLRGPDLAFPDQLVEVSVVGKPAGGRQAAKHLTEGDLGGLRRAFGVRVHGQRKSPNRLPVYRAIFYSVIPSDADRAPAAMQALLELAQANTELPGNQE